MRVIIAGCRDIEDVAAVYAAIEDADFEITEVVSGGATGVDHIGELWAMENGVPVKRFPAGWVQHGRAAGPIRNEQMAKYADALIAVWDGRSRGTANMIETARKHGLEVSVSMYVRGEQ